MTSKVEMLMRDQDVTLFTEKVRSTSILFSLMISRMQVWIICYSISNLESVWISNFLGYTVIIWPINKLYTNVFWLPFIHILWFRIFLWSCAHFVEVQTTQDCSSVWWIDWFYTTNTILHCAKKAAAAILCLNQKDLFIIWWKLCKDNTNNKGYKTHLSDCIYSFPNESEILKVFQSCCLQFHSSNIS